MAKFVSLKHVAVPVHLMLLHSVCQVLGGVALIQWGPQSVQDFFFTVIQGFVDLVYFSDELCSFFILRSTVHNS